MKRLALGFLALLPLAAADFFPVAVWYGGGKARAPMLAPDPAGHREEWRRDLRQIRSLGFNTIRCWIDWASGEPKEREYHFETIDTLLDLARDEGLKIVIQVYMDSAPDWVGRKYPDSLYVSASGAVMQPEAAPGYCRDHPGVALAEVAFYEAMARRAAKSPAFLGWDLWSEPHVINWATATYLTNPEFCFCRNTETRFRSWLQKKYGSLDKLNQAWYRRFESWEEVHPNRLSTILSYTDYIDWRTFLQDKLGADLRDRYDAVKRGAPAHVATSHAAAPSLFTSPLAGDGSPDDWIMRKQVDYYGTSFYPKHSYPTGRDPAWRGALLDFAKSSGYSNGRDGFWIGELQAGFGTVALNVSGTVTADDLRMWTWSAVARGAKAINYYAYYPMSTGYESGGFGLIQLDGAITERAKAAGEIARQIQAKEKLFAAARPVAAEVAIIFNPLTYFVGGRQRGATSYGPQSEAAGIERDSMLGVYRALFPSNVPVDFIHIRELGDLSRYKLVYLPYPLMLPSQSAGALKRYVESGGHLVAEARAGWNDEHGRAAETIPGLGLAEVFQCRETDVRSIPGGWTELILDNDDRLPGRLYEETLEPQSARAKVAARFADGRPAAVRAAYGKGEALALGSYVSTAYNTKPSPQARKFFEGLLAWAGVRSPVEVTGAEVEVRLLESGDTLMLFAFNHADHPVSATIKAAGHSFEAKLAAQGVWITNVPKR